jgi:hypothetical protein
MENNWILDTLQKRVHRLKESLAKAETENDAHELRLELQQTMDAINAETLRR